MCVPEGHFSLLSCGPVLSTLLLSEQKRRDKNSLNELRVNPGSFTVVSLNLLLSFPIKFSKIIN